MNKIKYIIIDVDGTMTDGGIYYDNNGNELKEFNVKDGPGFFAFREAGIKVVVVTGRESQAVLTRMTEMKVDYLFQNVKNKDAFLERFISDNGIEREELAYIGDDMNDYFPAKKWAGYIACPADACKEMLDLADYVSKASGGYGVVRDVAEHILSEDNQWFEIMKKIYED